MKALVIDRSKLMRILLRRILAIRGFEVVHAAAPPELADGWQDAAVVLVEWDLRSPGVPAFIARARRNGASRSVVVVLAGSQPESREVMRAELSGADHILVKPFTSAQLDTALFGGLSRFGQSAFSFAPSGGMAALMIPERPHPVHAAA